MSDISEVAASGAAAHITELFKKLAGPAFDEAGAMLGDTMRVYRVRNLLRTAEKTKKLLDDAGRSARPIPSRLLLPILDACSVEDDDFLQEKWAALLANASRDGDNLSPAFTETLKQLTPAEGLHLERLRRGLLKFNPGRKDLANTHVPYHAFTKAWEAPTRARSSYERLGLIRREFNVKLNSSSPPYDDWTSLEPELGTAFVWTDYADAFLTACQAPQPAPGSNR